MSDPQKPGGQPGRISEAAFLGVQWTITALSLLFVLFRLIIRHHIHTCFLLDDVLVILAWTMHLASAIIWQIKGPALYQTYEMDSESWETIAKDITGFYRAMIPLNMLYPLCLWCIKLAFLVFFRRLGTKIRSHQLWWLVVLVVTVGLGIMSVVDTDYKCMAVDFKDIAIQCDTPAKVQVKKRLFYVNCVADVVTDLMILSIPMLILWRIQINLRKKILLTSIFSATVLIMTVAILRVTIVHFHHTVREVPWLWLWASVETGTAIIVACTASFRQLFVTKQNQHLYGNMDGRQRAREKASMSFEWPYRVSGGWTSLLIKIRAARRNRQGGKVEAKAKAEGMGSGNDIQSV
ncbi:hypothetical protein BDW74DRAFT_175509 [Aspergillus multicolor]|uniref:uncharacterized protein n=1 Tax=Aspergillus multicolor TaxID=41759 RepID=UPI003CCC948D